MAEPLTTRQIIDGLRIHADRTSNDGWHTRALYMHAAADALEENERRESLRAGHAEAAKEADKRGYTADPRISNSRLKRTLEFDLSDAPAIAHALSVGASTAMLCSHPLAQQRLAQYRDEVRLLVSPEAKLFDEEVWCEIGVTLSKAEAFSVNLRRVSWAASYEREGRIVVTIGAKRWESDSFKKFPSGAPEVEAVYNVLSELAPLSCTGTFDNQLSKE